MLYNIAEPDKAYDKCHHLLNLFKSNETSHFCQMDQSIFVFRVFGCCFCILIQILIEYPVSKQLRTWSDMAVCGVCSWPVLLVYVPQKKTLV